MITTKQRAYLRGLANEMNPILHIGKTGVTENIIKQAEEALVARELFKGTCQQNSSVTAREAATVLCEALSAEPVSVVGRRFVIYRRNPKNQQIHLPK